MRKLAIAAALVVIGGLSLWVWTRPAPLPIDPFEATYTVATHPDFSRRGLPGKVAEYRSPAVYDILPDIDWRPGSVVTEVDTALEPDLYGSYRGDRLTIYCSRLGARVLFDLATWPGGVEKPPLWRGPQAIPPAEGSYIQQCDIQIAFRRREADTFVALVDRCTDAIAGRFGADALLEDVSPTLNIRVIEAARPVSTPAGRLMGAACWIDNLNQHLKFRVWFMGADPG